jgi:hypothetical protein
MSKPKTINAFFKKKNVDSNSFFFFFEMSAQERRGGFELVTSASLGVSPAD